MSGYWFRESNPEPSSRDATVLASTTTVFMVDKTVAILDVLWIWAGIAKLSEMILSMMVFSQISSHAVKAGSQSRTILTALLT